MSKLFGVAVTVQKRLRDAITNIQLTTGTTLLIDSNCMNIDQATQRLLFVLFTNKQFL